MSWDRAANDAFHRLLGYSQEYLDDVHKISDEYREMLAARGPQPPWEPAESDSEFDDADGAPLSPPPSPRPESEGPDLSKAAWGRRILADLARCIEPRDSGFDTYETWRSQMISGYGQKILPSPSPSPKSSIRRRHRRPTVAVSERITRSKASIASTFYQLGLDGKTGQPLCTTSSNSPSRHTCRPRVTRSAQKRKHPPNRWGQKR